MVLKTMTVDEVCQRVQIAEAMGVVVLALAVSHSRLAGCPGLLATLMTELGLRTFPRLWPLGAAGRGLTAPILTHKR